MTLRRKRITLVLSTGVGILVTMLMLFPLYWMIANSFETSQQIFSIPVALVPTHITFESYVSVWQTQLPHLGRA